MYMGEMWSLCTYVRINIPFLFWSWGPRRVYQNYSLSQRPGIRLEDVGKQIKEHFATFAHFPTVSNGMMIVEPITTVYCPGLYTLHLNFTLTLPTK